MSSLRAFRASSLEGLMARALCGLCFQDFEVQNRKRRIFRVGSPEHAELVKGLWLGGVVGLASELCKLLSPGRSPAS